MADPLRHLDGELESLAARGLLREPHALAPGLLDLCSNDYLGYGAEPWPEEGGHIESGARASRLVSGDYAAHTETEAVLAGWVKAEAALLFSSGYAANVGVLTALAQPGDVIVSDALNHASIIDGCRLSGATVRVVPHRSEVREALEAAGKARRRWVVTESYFSMDGDSPDLGALRAACDAHDAGLIVDEAHAVGVLGPRGAGLCAAAGVRPDVLIGTCGKALGLQGAFVAGSKRLRLWLWNRSRSFVFSTGVSPALATAIGMRARRAIDDDAGRARLAASASRMREALAALGVTGMEGRQGPVLPWVVGREEAAVRLSATLREHGVRVQPIRPPTVPQGGSRLRITATARLGKGEMEQAVRAFEAAARSL